MILPEGVGARETSRNKPRFSSEITPRSSPSQKPLADHDSMGLATNVAMSTINGSAGMPRSVPTPRRAPTTTLDSGCGAQWRRTIGEDQRANR